MYDFVLDSGLIVVVESVQEMFFLLRDHNSKVIFLRDKAARIVSGCAFGVRVVICSCIFLGHGLEITEGVDKFLG